MWLKLNTHFDSSNMELSTASVFQFDNCSLDIRDPMKLKHPSILFSKYTYLSLVMMTKKTISLV